MQNYTHFPTKQTFVDLNWAKFKLLRDKRPRNKMWKGKCNKKDFWSRKTWKNSKCFIRITKI